MKQFLTTFIGLAGAAILFVAPAQSAIVTMSLLEPVADIGVPLATTTNGTVYQNVTGSIGGVRRSPWENTSIPGGTYTSVSGGSFASYVLDAAISSFSFMWGSVDTYNTIKFFKDGIETGEQIVGQDGINAGAPARTGFGIATIFTDNEFNEIRFLSGGNAFEYANLNVSAVPLPAALPLYGAGLAVMGFIGWRKRRKAAAVA